MFGEKDIHVENRLQREKEFQNKKVIERTRASCSKFYTINRASMKFYEAIIQSNCRNRRVLDYGCGSGTYTFYLANHGAIVTGIDISNVTIEEAKKRALKENVLPKPSFLVMNAEDLRFNNSYFDMVCGGAILHHLDLDKALSEITRVLKRSGKAVFLEPLGHNFLINLYRWFTPQLRSRDEHPLLIRDFRLMRNYFLKVDINFFHLASLLMIPFRKLPVFEHLLRAAETVDKMLLKLPFLEKQAWQVVIILSQPQKP